MKTFHASKREKITRSVYFQGVGEFICRKADVATQQSAGGRALVSQHWAID